MSAETTIQPDERTAADRDPSAEEAGTGAATDLGQGEHLPHEAIERIANHADLTPALRQRLAELVQRQPPGEGPPHVPLDDVLAILAETVPSTLRLDPGELPIAPHPEGESYFTGDGASDADKHAAAIASEQLALSGLLRKP